MTAKHVELITLAFGAILFWLSTKTSDKTARKVCLVGAFFEVLCSLIIGVAEFIKSL